MGVLSAFAWREEWGVVSLRWHSGVCLLSTDTLLTEVLE